MLVLLLLIVPLASCGDGDENDARTATVYAAVVRALVPAPPDEDPTTVKISREVFIASVDPEEEAIPLAVQAAVVEALVEYTTIRFVDDREEALEEDEPDEPVRNDGVLVLLGPVPPRGDSIELDATRYVSEPDQADYTLALARRGTAWTVEDPPAIPRD